MITVEIRPSEQAKIPLYENDLQNVIARSGEIGMEAALSEWATSIIERRLDWYGRHKNDLILEGTEVRRGFQLVILEYMGIKPEEVPIIEETSTKITWYAYDFCPYLEAIQRVGLDTRTVCKYATEEPCQALLDAYNPKLKYSRNYQNIRPHTSYCEETIEYINV